MIDLTTLKGHSEAQPPGIHVPHRLIYANAADRLLGQNELNGEVLAVKHLFCWARQADNNTYWALVGLNPTTWWQIGGGAREETTGDVDIYVSTTGSDINGVGSPGNPYATFDRAYRDIKDKHLAHKVTWHAEAGTYTSFPREILLDMSPDGAFVFDCSGGTYPVVAGPFTIGSVDDVGPQDIWGVALATDLVVTPDPSWTPDEFYGKFIHFLTGSLSGYVFGLSKNTGDTLRTIFDLFGFDAGDTFEIVDLPVKIQVDHSVVISGVNVGDTFHGEIANRVYMAGVEFEIDTGAYWNLPFYIHNIDLVASSIRIVDMWDTDEWSIPLVGNNASVNMSSTPSGTFAKAELENWFSYAFQILGRAGSATPQHGYDVLLYGQGFGAGVASLMCRRQILSITDNNNLLYLTCGGVSNVFFTNLPYSIAAGSLHVVNLFIEQISFSEEAFNISNHNLIIESAYIDGCDLPMRLTENSFCLAQWLHGENVANANALEINRGSQFQIEDAAKVTIMGATNAAKWLFDDTVLAVWPTTGNFASKVNSYIATE